MFDVPTSRVSAAADVQRSFHENRLRVRASVFLLFAVCLVRNRDQLCETIINRRITATATTTTTDGHQTRNRHCAFRDCVCVFECASSKTKRNSNTQHRTLRLCRISRCCIPCVRVKNRPTAPVTRRPVIFSATVRRNSRILWAVVLCGSGKNSPAVDCTTGKKSKSLTSPVRVTQIFANGRFVDDGSIGSRKHCPIKCACSVLHCRRWSRC